MAHGHNMPVAHAAATDTLDMPRCHRRPPRPSCDTVCAGAEHDVRQALAWSFNAMDAARATHDGHVCGGAQDVYRRLTASAALGGLLRVRLSPELRVARAYGPLAADERCQSPRWQHLDCLIAGSSSVCDWCDPDILAVSRVCVLSLGMLQFRSLT